MEKEKVQQKENGKFKIICIKAPKWLSFLLRKFASKKEEKMDA